MAIQFIKSPKLQQIYLYVGASLALLLLLYCYALNFTPPFLLDDPYIVLHNAQVLHLGYDINYPNSPALTGTTSLIQLVLVAFLMFWLSPTWALAVVTWLALFAYALGLLRLAFIFSATCWQAFLVLLTGLFFANVLFHVLSGLETGLTMAALIWICILLAQPNRGVTRVLRCVFCGLLPFVRPELAIFSVLILVRQALDYWQQQRSVSYLLQNIIRDGLLALLSAAPWLLWYCIDLGTFYPATFMAKLAFFAENTAPFTLKLRIVFALLVKFAWIVGWPIFLGMWILLLLTPVGRLGLIFLLGFLLFYTLYFPVALNFNLQRYLYILIPIVLYSVISCLHHQDKLIRCVANGILLLTLLQALWCFPQRWNYDLATQRFNASQFSMLQKWCVQNIPANAVLLIHDAGYLAFTTHFHLIDMVGLKTPSVVAYYQRIASSSADTRRIQGLSAIIAQMHPRYFITVVEWNDVFHLASGLRKLGWQLQLLRPSEHGYLVYKVLGCHCEES